jgi:haloacid dehalogenase superfamily, subfamily IA, variant 1 with third motif having Dx(3-4)D or Dx(3-4)E
LTTHIIWDFNGTLIDDLDASVASVNDMLGRRGLPPITRERYHALIAVPIVRFYEQLFDLEATPMDVLMPEFQVGYEQHFDLAHPGDGALEALEGFRRAGVHQVVLSSLRTERIELILAKYGLTNYFGQIMGADDDLCSEKATRGLCWLQESGVEPQNVLVIGDLVHDFEVAQALGARCALLGCGHQGTRELAATGAPVYPDLHALYETERARL